MKIGVYYIATGKYKNMFKDFLNSLTNFFPSDEKVVKLISDGLEQYDGYKLHNIYVELCPRINHYPWPIITLYKHYHILENFDESCDYICYINGNGVICKNNPEEWFNPKKITVSYHSFGENYNVWGSININKYSTAYLENNTYDYIQGGFFIGPTNLVKYMCHDIVNMLHEDMSRHLFAQWHDESYINKWCEDNYQHVNKKSIMTVYKDKINSSTFIFLTDKNKYFTVQNKFSLNEISENPI